MKHTLKAPGSKRLKLGCEKLLSNFGFHFNLRRYSMAQDRVKNATKRVNPGNDKARTSMFESMLWTNASGTLVALLLAAATGQGLTLVHFSAQCKRFLCDRGCIQGLFSDRFMGVQVVFVS
jgi:hypothetical protein